LESAVEMKMDEIVKIITTEVLKWYKR
jgi:hypothetical protein